MLRVNTPAKHNVDDDDLIHMLMLIDRIEVRFSHMVFSR